MKKLIDKTLKSIRAYSPESATLVWGTMAHESLGFKHRKQVGGPALGLPQMEPDTHEDCWDNYLKFRPVLASDILRVSGLAERPKPEELIHNDVYAICMCRVRYLRAKGAIPTDLEGQAAYWKQHYNTAQGKGTVEKWLKDYKMYCHE
jgi:hypothetical protein